jgi:hypothetical protein
MGPLVSDISRARWCKDFWPVSHSSELGLNWNQRKVLIGTLSPAATSWIGEKKDWARARGRRGHHAGCGRDYSSSGRKPRRQVRRHTDLAGRQIGSEISEPIALPLGTCGRPVGHPSAQGAHAIHAKQACYKELARQVHEEQVC